MFHSFNYPSRSRADGHRECPSVMAALHVYESLAKKNMLSGPKDIRMFNFNVSVLVVIFIRFRRKHRWTADGEAVGRPGAFGGIG